MPSKASVTFDGARAAMTREKRESTFMAAAKSGDAKSESLTTSCTAVPGGEFEKCGLAKRAPTGIQR